MMPLPDFVGIGAEKSGTTWLCRMLQAHPEIYVPGIKEVRFFDRHFHRGADWYSEWFARAGKSVVAGEISPQYMHSPECCHRIWSTAPNTKLLVMLRDPVERAFSHYLMDIRGWMAEGVSVPSFEEALSADPKYLARGRYFAQLEPYFDRFGTENIHVESLRAVQTDPAGVCSRVYRFLCVDANYQPSNVDEVVNSAAIYRSPALFRLLQLCVHTAEKFGMSKVVRALKNGGFRDFVMQVLEAPTQENKLSSLTKRELGKYFVDEIEPLKRLVGNDVVYWDDMSNEPSPE